MKTYPNLISATINKDSISKRGERITTFKLVFPRIILAEFNTHRMFNRNSASSRAIPFRKMLTEVKERPFIPIAWQREHSGMQGTKYLTAPVDRAFANDMWLEARDKAVKSAKAMNKAGTDNIGFVTKQLCNRLLEPFIYHTVLVTATEWDNFFNLRNPVYETEIGVFKSKRDALISYAEGGVMANLPTTDLEWLQINKGQAEIHIMDLAEKMWDAYNESTPELLKEGEWHIPFNIKPDETKFPLFKMDLWSNKQAPTDGHLELAIKIATARCARISYETLGDNPKIDYEADIKLHDSLLTNGHMSVFEHCARVMDDEEYFTHVKGLRYQDGEEEDAPYRMEHGGLGWSRNLKGFIQYREIVEQNNN